MVEGFGLALVDILLNVPNKIVLNHKHVVSDQLFQIGGVIPTALIFLARLGVNCHFHTALADDQFGTMVREFLDNDKVSFHSIKKQGVTPTAAVAVEKLSGNRTGFYHLGVFSDLRQKDIDKIKFNSQSRFLLLDGHNFNASQVLIKKAKSTGLKILLDLGTYKPHWEQLIKNVDVAFIPEAFRQTLMPGQSPQTSAIKFQQAGPETAIVTGGEKGSYIASRRKVFHQPAYKVKAVDTNGAGDVFMGGFTYGLIKGWSLKKTAQFAAAAAALTCTRIGKLDSIPRSVTAVSRLIDSH